MKNKPILPLIVSIFAMILGLGACGGLNNSSHEPEVNKKTIVDASIDNNVLLVGEETFVDSSLEGLTYRSSNPSIATVDEEVGLWEWMARK